MTKAKNKKGKLEKNSFYIWTLGCQMNYSDSERLIKLFDKAGWEKANEKKADLILVNACSVRQKPIDRIFGKLKHWQKVNPQAQLVLTGCVLKDDKSQFLEKFDYYFKIDEIDKFASRYLEQGLSYKDYLSLKPEYKKPQEALVPIMTGCNNFCSYCVVPYTRGRERSRSFDSIIKEIKNLSQQNYRKITLLGQNVNSYQLSEKEKKDSTLKSDFVYLLEKINSLPGGFKVEFLTSHPKDMSQELIDAISSLEKLTNKVHLPVQSGDDEILRKMNRNYTADHYLTLVKKLKGKVDDLILSTDIIVGFPSETEEQFNNTFRLVRKAQFDKAYVAQYSPRKGTKAYQMKDDVSRKEKKRRWKLLDDYINQ